MIVSAGTENPSKLEGITKAFVRYYPDVQLRPVDASSIARAQPHGLEEMALGATARARHAMSTAGGDFGVGVEAGLFKIGDSYFDTQLAAIVDSAGKASLGHSAGYMLPKGSMEKLLAEGKELEEWAVALSGTPEVGDKGGLIQHLTKDRMTRAELTEQCVLTALIPWHHRGVYGF
ncbi:MAG: inosine/xanthosine triphosphatase [archaeon]|nr:MAG: inosine/xanthosine triphosphatase [archaeon]